MFYVLSYFICETVALFLLNSWNFIFSECCQIKKIFFVQLKIVSLLKWDELNYSIFLTLHIVTFFVLKHCLLRVAVLWLMVAFCIEYKILVCQMYH